VEAISDPGSTPGAQVREGTGPTTWLAHCRSQLRIEARRPLLRSTNALRSLRTPSSPSQVLCALAEWARLRRRCPRLTRRHNRRPDPVRYFRN